MRQEFYELIAQWLGDWNRRDFGFRTELVPFGRGKIEERLYLNDGDIWYFSFYSNNDFELGEDGFVLDGGDTEDQLEDLCKRYFSFITKNRRCFSINQAL